MLLPKFRLETAALRLESHVLFFLGQNDLYIRRGVPEVGSGGHNPPGRAWASWHAQVGYAHLVAPLWKGSSHDGITPLEGKSARAQVPPRNGGASPESNLLIFFARSK